MAISACAKSAQIRQSRTRVGHVLRVFCTYYDAGLRGRRPRSDVPEAGITSRRCRVL
jgi:hypothetical protein